MTKIINLIIVLLLISSSLIYSQPNNARGNASFDKSKIPAVGIIYGEVSEAETGDALEFANVIVKSAKDSTIVTGAITDKKGAFRITEVPFGAYFVEIKFIGYAKQIIKDVKVTPREKFVNLNKIKVKQNAVEGQEVDVVADRQYVDYKIDKRVVNVSQNLSAAGLTAVQALENVPSVQVDIDGNVSLRGSSNFTVYINGKPSILQGSEALQQIPSETIDRIEIITNPSAKYDPDGVSGIINVILKKEIREGLNGLFNATYGTWNKYSGDFLLNYFKDKFNFYVGGDYRDMTFGGGNDSRSIYKNDKNNLLNADTLDSDRERDHKRKGYSVKTGMGYQLSDMTSATLEGTLGMGGGGFFMNSKQHFFSSFSDTSYYSRANTGGLSERNYWGVNGTFQHKFDDIGHQIDANFQYSDETSNDPHDSWDGPTDSLYNVIDSSLAYESKTVEGEREKEFRFRADYVYPIDEKQKLEAGYSYRMDRTDESYLFKEFNHNTNVWDTVDKYTSDMTFTNDIHSIYSTYSGGISKFQYMVGLRGEYNYRNTQHHGDKNYTIDRWDIFPSFHLSYNLNDMNQLSASYTRRVNRPGGWDLDPWEQYVDAHNMRKGNPALEPEYSNSYELNYQYSFTNSSYASLEGYYRHRTNIITRVKELLDNGIIMNTVENINNDNSMGMEGMVNWRPYKWLNLSGSATYFNYQLNTILVNDTISRNTNTWSARFNAIFNLGMSTRIQFSGDYRAPSVSAQGTTLSDYSFNLAVRQDFLKNKLSLSINVRDVFATQRNRSTTNTQSYYSYDNMWREAPVVMFNLTYRLNNYKKDQKREMNGNGEGGEPMENF